MADLVADYRADRAEVLRGVSVRVEERRLQDRGGEGDVVDHRVVKRVDRLRGRHPFLPVGGLADLGQLVVVLERGAAADILHQVLAELQARVVAPLLRVADLGVELRELLQRALLRRLAHPLQLLDAGAVCGDQVFDQLQHLLLGRGREMLIDVAPPNILAYQALRESHPTLPAVALLGSAA